MGLINLPKVNQTQNNGGCLRRILTIAVIVFAVYFLMKSCGGGGVLDLGRKTSSESNTTTSTPTSTTTNNNTTTPYYDDLSWIVGTWSCEMGAYGTVVLKFEGDGTSGNCTEKHDGSTRYGTYRVEGNVLSYQLSGESIPKKISIEPDKKLLDESGSYYRKK